MILDTSHGFNIIEIISQPDCKDFSCLFNGLEGTHLVNPSKGDVRKLLREHPERPLILSGHGDSNGLYNHMWNGYVITSRDVDLLRKQQAIIGIWCYAGNFADKYNLTGFFTSMFISTEEESVKEGLPAKQEDISYESQLFCKRLNFLMKKCPEINKWPDILRSKANIHKQFVGFNYECLAYFNKTENL